MSSRGESRRLRDRVFRELLAPAARNDCYSAGEVRQRVAVVHKMRAELSPEESQQIEDQLPRGLIAGFEHFVLRDNDARRRMTGNHPKRLKFLRCSDSLPYVVQDELIATGAEGCVTADLAQVGQFWGAQTSQADREAIIAETEKVLLLLKFLARLSSAAKKKYPAMPLALLLLLLELLTTRGVANQPVVTTSTFRVARPPGRTAVAEPRLGRAPGTAYPSQRIAARAAPSCVRPRGVL